MTTKTLDLNVHLRKLHDRQLGIRRSKAKRKVVRAGRRAGKTVLAADESVERFLDGRRILYATPTQEQVDTFWFEVTQALREPINAGIFYKNETRHIIELPGTKQRIRAKTAWNADTLRGDFADYLILDEYQMMSEDAWGLVGPPMLMDNDGDAMFIYTQKRGKHHSKELFKRAEEDQTGRWETFSFSSHENPFLHAEGLKEITRDMTQLSYRMEILAEEVEDDPRALWSREIIDEVTDFPILARITVGVDPHATTGQTGIVTVGGARIGDDVHLYVLDDSTPPPGVKPAKWGTEAVAAYNRNEADRIVGEINHGGDMVENVILNVEGGKLVRFEAVRASRGKHVRAEPVAAAYEQGRAHHVGEFAELEDELCNWIPEESKWSPNRMDALVWAATDLMEYLSGATWDDVDELGEIEDFESPWA